MDDKIIKGKLQQISLDNKKNISGWLLLKSRDGDFFIHQNSIFFRNIFPRSIYITNNTEFVSTMTDIEIRRTNWISNIFLSIPITALIANLLKKNIPEGIFFGAFNSSGNFLLGMENILLVNFVVVAFFYLIAIYRRESFKRSLKKRGIELQKIGTVITNSPLRDSKGGIEGSSKSRRIIAYLIFFLLIIIPFLLVFPFYLQLRVMSIAVAFIGYAFFFNGNYAPDDRLVTYKIIYFRKS